MQVETKCSRAIIQRANEDARENTRAAFQYLANRREKRRRNESSIRAKSEHLSRTAKRETARSLP